MVCVVGLEVAFIHRGQHGIIAEVLPEDYQAEGLLSELQPLLKAGDHVLLPRGDLSRSVLPDTLKSWGVEVTEAVTYENVISDEGAEEVLQMLRNGEIHIVSFTSSSTVTNLLEILRRHGGEDVLTVLGQTKIACIGPVTADTALKHGLSVHYMAEASTLDGLIQAITADRSEG